MSLSLAFNTAQSSLLTTATKLSVSSRNVAAADDPSASRKIAVTTTTADGSARVVTISRATGTALFDRMLGATSSSASLAALSDGLTALQQTVGDPEDATSPAGRLGTFTNALARAAHTPDDPTLAQAAVTAAQDLTQSLNDASRVVQDTRVEADAKIASSVAKVRDLLGQFQVENEAVVTGSVAGQDVTDAMDRRDAILAQLSEQMGVSTFTRANNDVVIYTDSGATLFEKTPRSTSFEPSRALDAATAGKAVFVDGVAVTGPDATMPLKSGAIAGLTQLRDEIAPTFQTQLDEMARGLISAFAEADQSGSGGPSLAGLFTPGGSDRAVPTALTAGLAARLAVNPAADAGVGGDPALLRDGGMNGPAYAYNASGAASFAGRLSDLSDALAAAQSFDPASGLSSTAGLGDFAAASVSWLQGKRQDAAIRLDGQQAVLSQTSSALSAATGVNLDQEYAAQLELERSYQASSKLMGVVSQLYDVLFSVIR